MPKILVSDPISEAGIEILRKAGEVHVRTGQTEEEILQFIADFDAMIVRSETKVTARIIEKASKMRIIGRAGVGVDNIDLKAATQRGIIVVNSPAGNTTAAAELTIGLLLCVARNIPQAHCGTINGKWDRKKYVGSEVYRKTLGVIGLGKIGREVAKRARALGMHVIGYDPFTPDDVAQQAGVHKVDLDELFNTCDFLTVHTPLNDQTRNLVNAERLSQMKPSAMVVNVARGGIINEADLAAALKDGRIAGAAVDVFTSEPIKEDNPLIGCPHCILTPHLGASTVEAQEGVAVDVAQQIADVLAGGPARSAVNMPAIDPEMMERLMPYFTLTEKMGSLLAQLYPTAISKAEVQFTPDFADCPVDVLARSAVAGLLQPQLAEPVNSVNAPVLAQARGLQVSTSMSWQPRLGNYASAVGLTIHASDGEHEVTGTVLPSGECRILDVDGFRVDIVPHGNMIFTRHIDRPGVIGRVGTLLGNRGVNVAGMHLGRESVGGTALMVLMVDSEIDDQLLSDFRALDGMGAAQVVSL